MVPRILAVNVCVVAGATFALGGETLTTMCARIVICAFMNCVGSASLAAVSVTGFGEGTSAGARYSTVPAGAVFTTWHGLEATTQICPTTVLPPAIPATCQITFEFEVPETAAVNGCRCPTAAVTADGVNVTEAVLVSATVAGPETFGFTALTA